MAFLNHRRSLQQETLSTCWLSTMQSRQSAAHMQTLQHQQEQVGNTFMELPSLLRVQLAIFAEPAKMYDIWQELTCFGYSLQDQDL